MTDDFYRAFEDRYRGSRELIQSRLRVYLPFVEPLKRIHPDCRAVDLGCGRGEWLALMGEVGIDAHGVDLDDGMLAACRERGLSVEQRDAIEYLKVLPAESVAVVSAFHVVEHIPFAVLQTLVREALRVLVPAGLIILETPNPENLSVGANTFYLDPTHERPIPPALLAFLPEHCGFARTKVLRLQEAPGLREATDVTLTDVLMGVSPDYAIVAQKRSRYWKRMARFDAAFSKDYGLDLGRLAMNYDSSVGGKLGEILARVDRSAEFEGRAAAAEAGSAQANAQLAARVAEIERLQAHIAWQQGGWDGVKAELSQTQAELGVRDGEIERLQASIAWQQAGWDGVKAELSQTQAELSQTQAELSQTQAELSQTQAQLAAMYASTSWRVSAPLRRAVTTARSLARLPRSALLRLKIWLKPRVVRAVTHPVAKRLIERTGRWVNAHPRLLYPIRSALGRNERTRNRLRWLVLGLPPPGEVVAGGVGGECLEPAATRQCPPTIPHTDGINAGQRGLLEAFFHAYVREP